MRIVEEIFMNEIATFLVQVIFSVILFLDINKRVILITFHLTYKMTTLFYQLMHCLCPEAVMDMFDHKFLKKHLFNLKQSNKLI